MMLNFKIKNFKSWHVTLRRYASFFYLILLLINSYWVFIVKEGSFMFFIIPLVLLIGSLIDNSVLNTAGEGFVYVNSDVLSWNTTSNIDSSAIALINWSEIEWIKFAKDGISFYKASSFVDTFLITNVFTQEQKEKLTATITEIASEKNIKLVY